MRKKQFIAYILHTFLILVISSCTTQAWYESVKQGAANNCRKEPPSESERCLGNLNKQTYEEYKKNRSNENPP